MLLAFGGDASALNTRAHAQAPAGQAATATNPTRYRVNYRPDRQRAVAALCGDPKLDKANAIAAEFTGSGYLSQVVNDLTPSPQPFPDAAETSASRYYPTSNWASDYNYYVVPGGNYNYGWYGG